MGGGRVTVPAPEELFAVLVEEFAAEPDVTPPGEPGARGFGSSALRSGGSIFAMVTRDHLVVKLPRARVAALIEDGDGGPFDANRGKPMKEWLTVLADDEDTWRSLAREALDFVRGAR